jgi:hypothetical protein
VSAVLQEHDETIERALFERRARARGDQAGVPSLDDVLRAARGNSSETAVETSSVRRRAWGLALAAACLLTVMKARPSEGTHPGIVADVRAESAATIDPGAGLCEEQQVAACTPDTTCASAATEAPAPQEDGLCSATPTTLASSATLSCAPDEPVRSELH